MRASLTLLFDLDGTMVDTDALHVAAWNALLAESGRELSLHDYRTRVMGAPNDAIMQFLFSDHPPHGQHDLAQRKEQEFRARVRSLRATAGLLDLLVWAEERDVRCGVVTNAPRPNAELLLEGLGLAGRFPVLVIGDELPRGKPDPMPYQEGLRLLGGIGEQSVAFEDSLSGVRAASAAGIYTFGMRTALDDALLRGAGASAIIDDFTDREMLARLVSMLK